MRWLSAILIGSAVLGIGCWFAAGFVADVEALLFGLMEGAEIAFIGSAALLFVVGDRYTQAQPRRREQRATGVKPGEVANDQG
jgi:hypothetical protein